MTLNLTDKKTNKKKNLWMNAIEFYYTCYYLNNSVKNRSTKERRKKKQHLIYSQSKGAYML